MALALLICCDFLAQLVFPAFVFGQSLAEFVFAVLVLVQFCMQFAFSAYVLGESFT